MDEATTREIDKTVQRTLREAGTRRPPVRLEPVIKHLELHRDYYDLQDPSYLDRAKHKMVVGGRKLVEIVRKVSLQAVLFFDEKRIVLDDALPEIKRDWPSAHECVHKILPWHQAAFYGDTAQTLSPEWHERYEAEANYGASALLFCGDQFTGDARDTKPSWAGVDELKRRYGKSFSLTLRRYERFGPQRSMAMLCSTPWWQEPPNDQDSRVRHFVRSPSLESHFSRVSAEDLADLVDAHANRQRGGMVADFTLQLNDDNDSGHEFRAQSFFNTHYLQTLFVEQRELTGAKIVVPRLIPISRARTEHNR